MKAINQHCCVEDKQMMDVHGLISWLREAEITLRLAGKYSMTTHNVRQTSINDITS